MTIDNEKIKLPMLPTGKPNISFSEMNDWHACSYRHYLKNVKKIDLSKMGPPLVFGTAVHAACEDFLRTREMKVDIALNLIRDGWEKHKELETFKGTLTAHEKGAVTILTSVPQFIDENFPEWEFIDAEHNLFESVNAKAGDFKFKGFIDGVIKCAPKRGKKRITWIIDWKTSTSGWRREAKQDAMKRNQLILYKKFWVEKMCEDPKNVRTAFIILNRTGKPNKCCEKLDVSAGPIVIDRAEAMIKDMLTSVSRGTKIKNRYSCRFCDYYETEHCDSWARMW